MKTNRKRALVALMVALVCCGAAVGQTTDDLIAVRKAFAAALDSHDVEAVVSFFTEDGVWDFVPEAPPFVGKEQIGAAFAAHFTHSPDWRTNEGRVLAAGNTVVVEHAALGTQTGPLADLPPSGKAWTYPHLDLYDFEGTKIKRLTSYGDNAGFYIQVGAMPAPEVPPLVPTITVPAAEPTGLSPLAADAELIRRWNSHDAATTAKIYGADCRIFAGPLGASVDRVAMTAMNELYFGAFPDIKMEVVRRLDLGNGWVATEFVTRGTQQGTFMGVPAQGYPIEIRAAWLTHFSAEGLLIEGGFYYDNVTMMNQMTIAPFPVEGVWITCSPTPLGNLMSKTLYTAQDAAKTKFGGTLEFINALPLLTELYPDYDPSLALYAGGQAVMVGRDKYEATYLGYYRKLDPKTGTIEIVGIDTLNAHFEVLGPDRLQGYGTSSFYVAAQDADQDGFPDEGQTPVLCAPWTWTSRRLTVLPGCTPTPQF
jgi:steroid delta-isomerase-like uncharacterized protein